MNDEWWWYEWWMNINKWINESNDVCVMNMNEWMIKMNKW